MNANRIYKTCLWTGAVAAAALAMSGTPDLALAQSGASKKLVRQIEIMEKIVDEILIESPNFLVGGGRNAHGIYLEEFGMLFSFEASIINKASGDWADKWKELSKRFNVRRENGKTIIEYGDEDDDNDKIEVDEEDWRKKFTEDQEKHYNAGKEELATTLLDYGDTLTGLRDDQTVAIAAFLRGNDWFTDNEVSTVVVSAKLSDLRSFSKGSLSAEAMKGRITYQEY